MRRVFGALFIAFLVLAVAVTPLLATFRPASFDLLYTESSTSLMRVTLEDQTGLVMGFNVDRDLPESPGGTATRSLVLSWTGGCRNPDIFMQLIPNGGGYLLIERTSGDECFFDIGYTRTFSIALRAPIDSSAVQIVHE